MQSLFVWGWEGADAPTPRRGAGERAESPLLAAVRNSPLVGIDAPTPAREKGLQPHGALYCFGWRSEGVQANNKRDARQCGPRRLFAPRKAPVFSRRLRSEGVQGASGKPPASNCKRQLCRKKFPLAGSDAPTPARIGTCRPMGRSHFSFGGERKVCKRKPAARRLREKALYCPF